MEKTRGRAPGLPVSFLCQRPRQALNSGPAGRLQIKSTSAKAASRQSDPDLNAQARTWAAPAFGAETGRVRACNAPEIPPPLPMSPARRAAERHWRRITHPVAT